MNTFEKIGISERADRLLKALYAQAKKDRSPEWLRKEDFEYHAKNHCIDCADIAAIHSKERVIIRKAHAIKRMLDTMTDEKVSERTLTYTIGDDELIVGVLPMGSNGLGKVFPNYMTEDEQRIGSFTNRSEFSILGHNTVNYDNLLDKGLDAIIDDAESKLSHIKLLNASSEIYDNENQNKKDFYSAVIISCKAVIAYANKFADLAAQKAQSTQDQKRKTELLEIERICRKVPAKKPDTFQEALQGIYTFHVALHASMNLLSLGRLDQVLVKHLDKSKIDDAEYLSKCTELFECFIIKAAWRLNLTTEYLLEQDHLDHSSALGVHPCYLDQRAGANNFLQNIIVGGKTPDGNDAANIMTQVILNAFENVNLSTPGIYVRLHKDSPQELKEQVAGMISKTKNLPGILNDDVLIPAFYNSLVENEVFDRKPSLHDLEERKSKYLMLANDYCVDGCWEPILNGISDWTFGMISGMTIMQCAFNRGATLDTNPGMLRGGKMSFTSDEVTDFESFKDIFKKHMQFFVDQSTFGLYYYYLLDEFVNPSPLFSSVLGTCMEKGRDKSWGGTEYNIGGTILTGVPDIINTISAIKKWVFDKKKYKLSNVLDAMRSDFQAPLPEAIEVQKMYDNMKVDFRTNSPKLGNGEDETNRIGNFVIQTYCDAIRKSKKLADKVFLKSLRGMTQEEKVEISRLRKVAGYYGHSLETKFGDDFNIRFTAGCGTFEMYPQLGLGVVASSDRNSNDPLVANFSPAPGTVTNTAAHVLQSLKALDLERLGAGAITDLCIDEAMGSADCILGLLNSFITNEGNMLTLTVGNSNDYKKIYELSVKASKAVNAADKKAAYEELQKYSNINVRVGGWQAPFISMSLPQQENYLIRVLTK